MICCSSCCCVTAFWSTASRQLNSVSWNLIRLVVQLYDVDSEHQATAQMRQRQASNGRHQFLRRSHPVNDLFDRPDWACKHSCVSKSIPIVGLHVMSAAHSTSLHNIAGHLCYDKDYSETACSQVSLERVIFVCDTCLCICTLHYLSSFACSGTKYHCILYRSIHQHTIY